MVRKVLLIAGILLLMSSPAAFAAVADLPQTGQTACYDTAGAVISCAGTGQDGELQKGVAWPSPRFTTTGTGDACILDNLTGLMWMRNPPSATYTWQGALDYANGRNAANLCGFNSGWRLPNISELRSLLNEAEWLNTIWLESQGFNTMFANQWSSTTYMNDGTYTRAIVVAFNNGYDDYPGKTDVRYVMPVRGPDTPGPAPVWRTGQTGCWDTSGNPISCAATGQDGDIQAGAAWPAPRFAVGTGGGADCVTDNLTDLMWVRSPGTGQTTWQAALDSANSRTLCGFSDWRLPNIVELRSLFNYGETTATAWLNSQGFSDVQSNYYWSSNTYAGNHSHARIASMRQQTLSWYSKDQAFVYAWAVRDLAAPDISLSPGAIDFGDVIYSLTSPIQTINITNTGTADLVISSIEITGTSPTMFSAVTGITNGCVLPNATVIPGESCTLDVTFTPDILGVQDALLYINSNDPDTPRVQVSLAGNGVMAIMNPLEGTTGSEITILGSGFGDSKGKVLIGTTSAKVTGWTNSRITCTVKKAPLPVGPFPVQVTTKSKQTIDIPDSFTVKNPELDPLTVDNNGGIPGAEIVLTGRFIGTKKGKVYLEELSSGKKKSCKVTYWYMNPTTGASEVRFIVPKVSKSLTFGPHPLTIVNKIGVAAASENFVIGLP